MNASFAGEPLASAFGGSPLRENQQIYRDIVGLSGIYRDEIAELDHNLVPGGFNAKGSSLAEFEI